MDENQSAIPSYVTSLLRTAGGLIGGYLIGKGYISGEQAATIGGALLALVVAGWSMYSKYKANAALNAAIAAPKGFAK